MNPFVEGLKEYIKNHPEIAFITNRGLETSDHKVIFIAKNLWRRFPELQKCLPNAEEEKHINEEIIETVVEVKTTKKNKKKA